MAICPNLSNPQIRKDFFELEAVVGENLAYYFWDINNGYSIDKDSKGNRNQLFVDVLDSTGDRTKAIQIAAVALGEKYQQFAKNLTSERKTNNLPSLNEFQVMNSFLETTSSKNLESLVTSTFKGITEVKAIGKALNASDKRDIKEEREYRKQQTPTSRQQAAAYSWFSTSPLAQHISFRVATRLANTHSIAQWTENALTLFKGADYTDLYHEAWHEFSQSYLTTAERNIIYAELRNRVGTYNYNGVEIPYQQLTRKQAEEVLAEEFRSHMLSVNDKKVTPKPKTFLERIFNKISDFFNFLFKGKTKEETKSVIQDWFDKLQTGNITAKRNFANNEWTRLNISKVFTQDFHTDSRITLSDEMNLAIKNGLREIEVIANYADGLYKLSDNTVVRLTKIAENRYRVTPVTTLEFDSIEGAELVSSLNYMFYEALNELGLKVSDLLTLDRNAHKEAVYERMQEKLTAYFEERKGMYLQDPDSVGNEFVNVFDILNMWDDVKAWHKKFLNKELSDYDDMVESAMVPDEENERGRSSKDFDSKTAADINPKELADPIIISMIKGLPKIDPDFSVDGKLGLARGSEFMLPLSGDYNTNYNILLNALSGMTVYEKMVDKIKELAVEFPQFTYLLEQLPTSIESAKTDQDLQLIQAFKQAMSLPRITPWGLRIKSKTVTGIGGPSIVYDMELFELNTTGGAKVKEQLDNQFAIDASRKYRKIDSKTGEAFLDTRAILADYGKFFDEYPKKLSVDGKTMYTFLKDVFNMDFAPYSNTKKVQTRSKDFQEFAIQMFTRVKLYDALISTGKAEPIIRPLGKLSTNFGDARLKELEKMGFPTTLTKNTNKFKVGNIRSTANNILSLYDDLKQFYGDQSYINIEGELQWGMHQWNELAYKINQINQAKTTEDLANNLQTSSLVTSGFFPNSLYMKKLFSENGKKQKRGVNNEDVQMRLLGWQGMSIQQSSDTKRGNKSVDLTPEDKFAYDFFSYLNVRLVENLRFGAKSSAYSIQFAGSKADLTLFPEEDFLDGYPPEFYNAFSDYLRYEMNQIKKAKKDSDRKFVIFDGIFSPELEKQLIENAVEGKGFRDYSTKIREELRAFFDTNVETSYESLKYSLLDRFNTMPSDKQDAEMVKAFKKLLPDENIPNAEAIKNKLRFYLANYFAHQVEVVHLFVGNPRNYQTKGKGYKEVFKRLGFTSSPGRQPLVEDSFFNKLQVLGVTRELEQISNGKERPYNAELKIAVAKDFGPHQNNSESIMKYFEVQILREIEAIYGKTSKEYKELTKKGSNKLKQITEERYKDYANQSKEADAQAWGNLDSIRLYLKTINRWNPTLEDAYKKEVEIYRLYKKLKQAPKKGKVKLTSFDELKDTRAGDEARLYDLINTSGAGLFPSLKTGLYGTEKDNPDDTILGKFSLHALLPSVVIGAGLEGTDLADVMDSMFETGVDILTFGSGQKMSFPFPEYEIYDKDMKVNKIAPNMVGTYSLEGLREQQYIAPKFKGEATLSTQLVKLLFGDFFENGSFSKEYPKEFQSLVEDARRAFIESIQHTVELEQLDLAKAMGITFEKNKVTSVNKNKFYKWLQKEGEKRDVREDFFNFLQEQSDKENPLSLDSLSYRNLAERMFVAALNKRLIRPKLKGEPYIQTASTGYGKKGTRLKNPTAEQIEKYGINNLKGYSVVNGKVQPAEIKIAFNPKKHAPLLNLEFKGSRIGDLSTLNKALLDEDWVEANKAKLTIVGVRIPVQGHNSMEMFRIKEFLPTSAGPIMIVNPDIVTKSGSDFDIDKLFIYEPTFNDEGQLFNIPYSKEAYKENLEKLAEKQEVIAVLAEQIEALETEMQNNPYFETFKFYEMIYFKDKDILEKLHNMDLGKDIVTNKKLRASINEFKTSVIEAKKAAANAKLEGDLDQLFFAKLAAFNESYRTLLDSVKELKTIPKGMLATSHNKVVSSVSQMMSEPIMFNSLTKPNNNDYLHSFITDFYNRIEENKGSSKRYSNVEDISKKIKGAEIFLPTTSTRIQREVIGAKSPLGISAKINAMHKLFQQAGLKFIDPFYNLYYLPAQRDKFGDITLGNRYTTDGILISDISSQFINGNVDAEKEDWINRIFADKVRTALYQQMTVLNGTSLEASTVFLLQPVMNEYFRDSKQGKFKQAVAGMAKGADKVLFEYIIKTATRVNPKLLVKKKGKVVIKDTVSRILSEYGHLLSDLNFENGFKNMTPSTANVQETKFSKALAAKELTKTQKDFLTKQLAVIAQYYVVKTQNDAVVALNQNVDFNTTNYQSGQAIFNQFKFLKEGEINGTKVYDIFNKKALSYIKEESVVSPFNVAEFGTNVMSNVFTVTGNINYKERLNNYMEALKASNKLGFLVTGKRAEKFIRDFNDEFILSLLWNYGGIGNQAVEKVLPRSLFRPNNPNSLFDRWKSMKESKEESYTWIMENMNFANYLTFRKEEVEIPGTRKKEVYYYPIMTQTGSSDASDAYTYELASMINDYVGETPEITDEVRKFFFELSMGVMAHQGFKLQRNTLQSIISASTSAPYFDQAINTFLPYLNAEKGTEEYEQTQAYFSKFLKNHYEQLTNKLPNSPYMKNYGREEASKQAVETDVTYQEGSYDDVSEDEGDVFYEQEEPAFMKSFAEKAKKEPRREYTPENITSLKPNEVFVFGSNAEGAHGKGAALTAKQKFGAKQGQAEGLQGQSYAIITKKNWRVEKSSTLEEIGNGIMKFVSFASMNPNKKFYVTKLGSSLAGYTVEEIKNLWNEVNKAWESEIFSDIPDNIILPKEYEMREKVVEKAKQEKFKLSFGKNASEQDNVANLRDKEDLECSGKTGNTGKPAKFKVNFKK